jgi:hypothetical protein
MLHHISIPARDPAHVAGVLAEIMNGGAFPFPGPLRGAFIAMQGDAHGTIIEVYPETIAQEPGKGEAQVVFAQGAPATHAAFHALISVPTDRATVEAIGAREGWRTKFFGRAAPGKPPAFHLIEMWIDNRVMLEFVTPDLVDEYTSYMQIGRIESIMRERARAAAVAAQ